MKFLIDMPLSPDLAVWLNTRGHDAIHAANLGFDTAPDDVILEYAVKEDRIVITADLDFPRLFSLAELSSPGLILFRGGNFSEEEVVALFEQVLTRLSEEEIRCFVTVVEKNRIRRRALPIKNLK